MKLLVLLILLLISCGDDEEEEDARWLSEKQEAFREAHATSREEQDIQLMVDVGMLSKACGNAKIWVIRHERWLAYDEKYYGDEKKNKENRKDMIVLKDDVNKHCEGE